MNHNRTIIFGTALLAAAALAAAQSHLAPVATPPQPRSSQYEAVENSLARGWNTWDVHSVATQVLLPEGLAIHVGMKHNTSLNGDAWLGDALIGRLTRGAEVVTPGPHAWDGSYTSADYDWKGHKWRVESAHDGDGLVMLVTPLGNTAGALPPTVVFSVTYLWDRPGMVMRLHDRIETFSAAGTHPTATYCTCSAGISVDVSSSNDYFATPLTEPVGLSTGNPLSIAEIQAVIARQKSAYEHSIAAAGPNAPILDAIQTTLGWDTIYDPEQHRVFSPVSRVWSVSWGGYVLFDWDTFFAATLASMGDKNLAYANALETLREETPEGFVPNFARAGGWKSFDRSEPPVGAITVLGVYQKFHDRWFLEDAFEPLLRWNRWWASHRDLDGYLTWGSDPQNQPRNPDDASVGTWQGAIYESGLDNSPMYDGTVYNPKTHLLEYADVGLMSLYVADCDALAQIADTLGKGAESKELRSRAAKYRAKLASMWDPQASMFLNIDLHTGKKITRLSPTNFYPLLAKAATPEQAQTMIRRHLLNPHEFWGEYVIPSIARDDPAFRDQNYWRGRIWGPMNYLVYLGLRNYDLPEVQHDFAAKSYALFLKEWTQNHHVHENYNAITGSGDDVQSSDRFYHWGALLGYIESLEQEHASTHGSQGQSAGDAAGRK
ncbi:MAG: MGH1-like glycoside hydrolase domain-containing protein [Acidobacteriota bacterium]